MCYYPQAKIPHGAKRSNTLKPEIPLGAKCANTLKPKIPQGVKCTTILNSVWDIVIFCKKKKLDKNTNALYEALKLEHLTTIMTQLFQGNIVCLQPVLKFSSNFPNFIRSQVDNLWGNLNTKFVIQGIKLFYLW